MTSTTYTYAGFAGRTRGTTVRLRVVVCPQMVNGLGIAGMGALRGVNPESLAERWKG